VTDVSLNWALAKSGVVPPAQAFRNLSAAQLAAHGTHSFHCRSESTASCLTVAASTGAAAAETKPLVVQVGASGPVANAYAVVMKKVVDHLNGSTKVFVQDGAIGASGKEFVAVRAISDHASSAAQAQSLLHVQPLRAPNAFKPALTVFSAAELQLPEAVKADLGAASHSGAVIMVNPSKQRVVVVGHSSAAAVQQALGAAGVSVLGAPVAAFVAAPAASNAALVVGPAVAGAALTLWGPQGFSAAFANGSSSAALAAANVWRAPANVFLCTRDSTGALPAVAKLTTPAQQKLHFALRFLPIVVSTSLSCTCSHCLDLDSVAPPRLPMPPLRPTVSSQSPPSPTFSWSTPHWSLMSMHWPTRLAPRQSLALRMPTLVSLFRRPVRSTFFVLDSIRHSVLIEVCFGIAGALGLDGNAQSSNGEAAKKLVAELTAKAKKEQPKLALDGAFAAAL
jgi:hypothetical protein